MQDRSLKSSILAWGWTLSLFLLLSYLICIAFGLLAPKRFHMHEAWEALLPGFEWVVHRGDRGAFVPVLQITLEEIRLA